MLNSERHMSELHSNLAWRILAGFNKSRIRRIFLEFIFSQEPDEVKVSRPDLKTSSPINGYVLV